MCVGFFSLTETGKTGSRFGVWRKPADWGKIKMQDLAPLPTSQFLLSEYHSMLHCLWPISAWLHSLCASLSHSLCAPVTLTLSLSTHQISAAHSEGERRCEKLKQWEQPQEMPAREWLRQEKCVSSCARACVCVCAWLSCPVFCLSNCLHLTREYWQKCFKCYKYSTTSNTQAHTQQTWCTFTGTAAAFWAPTRNPFYEVYHCHDNNEVVVLSQSAHGQHAGDIVSSTL